MGNDLSRKWSDIRGLALTIPSAGRRVGTVEDFYFKYGTGAIYSLLINIPILGQRALPVTGISTIERDAVTIPNQEVLLTALPPLPKGNNLLTSKVVGESGAVVATVSEVLVGARPPGAMWIAGFELVSASGKPFNRPRRITAMEVLHYRPEMVIITDQDARRLK